MALVVRKTTLQINKLALDNIYQRVWGVLGLWIGLLQSTFVEACCDFWSLSTRPDESALTIFLGLTGVNLLPLVDGEVPLEMRLLTTS